MTKTTYSFQLDVLGLEIARGYDGLLRGKPEPVLVVGVYAVCQGTIRTVDRTLHCFRPEKPFPSMALPLNQTPIHSRAVSERQLYFVIVAIALEEDNGKDVQRLYGAMERHQDLTVWSPATVSPVPLSLAELPEQGQDWIYPKKASLLVDEQEASSSCSDDKWIGAVAWTVPPGDFGGSGFRLHFAQERNDWTALVKISLSLRRNQRV